AEYRGHHCGCKNTEWNGFIDRLSSQTGLSEL
ncbi:unnamed protein product, partial [marine sediment metagenome]